MGKTVRPTFSASRRSRTIPTRVGKTRRSFGDHSWNADHPHAGGENVRPEIVACRKPGPSPRGWGKRSSPGFCSAYDTDHPHAGGENAFVIARLHVVYGPSPRGWGKRSASALVGMPSRTIPTRVGKTFHEGVFRSHHFRTIPTRVGKTLDFQRLTVASQPFFGSRYAQKGQFSDSTHSSATSQSPLLTASLRRTSP